MIRIVATLIFLLFATPAWAVQTTLFAMKTFDGTAGQGLPTYDAKFQVPSGASTPVISTPAGTADCVGGTCSVRVTTGDGGEAFTDDQFLQFTFAEAPSASTHRQLVCARINAAGGLTQAVCAGVIFNTDNSANIFGFRCTTTTACTQQTDVLGVAIVGTTINIQTVGSDVTVRIDGVLKARFATAFTSGLPGVILTDRQMDDLSAGSVAGEFNTGATSTAASCAIADVRDAINVAFDGAMTQIPAGTCSITADAIRLQTGKRVYLRGAGTTPDWNTRGAATSSNTIFAFSKTTGMFTLIESPFGNHRLSNITITIASGASVPSGLGIIGINDRVAGAYPVVIDHVTIAHAGNNSARSVAFGGGRGVFTNNLITGPSVFNGIGGVDCHLQSNETPSWESSHTLGMGDVVASSASVATGGNHLYVENNEMRAISQAVDASESCRIVFRYNTMINSPFLAHGADSGENGTRHAEIYNNTFTCSGSYGNALTGYWVHQRGGGPWIYTDNTFGAITGVCTNGGSPSDNEATAAIYKLFGAGTAANPSFGACWYSKADHTLTRENATTARLTSASPHGLLTGQTISVTGAVPTTYSVFAATATKISDTVLTYPFASGDPAGSATTQGFYSGDGFNASGSPPGKYPSFHQAGWGWVTGATTTTADGSPMQKDPNKPTRGQDLEPSYYWNNSDATPASSGIIRFNQADNCGNGYDVADFFQVNREWYARAPQAGDPVLTSYTKYAYPHPIVEALHTGWPEQLQIQVR